MKNKDSVWLLLEGTVPHSEGSSAPFPAGREVDFKSFIAFLAFMDF